MIRKTPNLTPWSVALETRDGPYRCCASYDSKDISGDWHDSLADAAGDVGEAAVICAMGALEQGGAIAPMSEAQRHAVIQEALGRLSRGAGVGESLSDLVEVAEAVVAKVAKRHAFGEGGS